MSAPPAIGSVLPWPEPTTGASLWARWTEGFAYVSAYGSARSALAAVLRAWCVRRVWLPAYACTALADAARGLETLWYGVDAALEPKLPGLRSGDAVIGIDYFGRCPRILPHLAAARPDVFWIEDRAQALDTGRPAWGDVVLYSPRKLVGVAEGGLLVSQHRLPVPRGAPSSRCAAAQHARRADPDGLRPDAWFPAFRLQEAAFATDDAPMMDATRHILQRIAASPLAAQRRANAALLAQALPDLALWPGPPDFAPLAFPIRLNQRDGVAARLAQQGIYCARHWTELPSHPARFPLAHRLSRQLLCLPCDQRYGPADMARIVAALREAGARRGR